MALSSEQFDTILKEFTADPTIPILHLAKKAGCSRKAVRKALNEGAPSLGRAPIRETVADVVKEARANLAADVEAAAKAASDSTMDRLQAQAAEKVARDRQERAYLVKMQEHQQLMMDAQLDWHRRASSVFGSFWTTFQTGEQADRIRSYLNTGVDPTTGKVHSMSTFATNLERFARVQTSIMAGAETLLRMRQQYDEQLRMGEYEVEVDEAAVDEEYLHILDAAVLARDLLKEKTKEDKGEISDAEIVEKAG